MSVESLSPEERLLRLIRKGRPKKEEAASTQAAAVPPQKGSPPSRKSFQKVHAFENLERVFSSAFGGAKTSHLLTKANRLLRFGFGALLCLFLFTLFWEKSPKGDNVASISPSEGTKSPFPIPSQESPRKLYSYYGEDIEKRDIFRSSFQGTSKEVAVEEKALKEFTKDLNLLGIVTGKNPQAIIEDKKEGKTYFVNKGDSIGVLRVEEIREDRVILNYQGEQLDLTL